MNQTNLSFLQKWFLLQRRELPWRQIPAPSPYAVWVSEVMLQQTQVAVVVPYFERWMQRFPTIESLAKAPIEEVIKEWEGLGYYSRARNLHNGAQHVLENFGGVLPASAEALQKIKGLGPYTVGAILNFAFHQRVPAVDGNVQRVITRYNNITDDICKSKTIKEIYQAVESILPEQEPWIISEALIELGATICGRRPRWSECPLKNGCKGYLSGNADQLPVKSVKTTTTLLYRSVAVIIANHHVLVRQGAKGKVMADLYEFPYFEHDEAVVSQKETTKQIGKKLGLKVCWDQKLPEVQHSFTRYRATLFPSIYKTSDDEILAIEDHEWHSIKSLGSLPFSSGHRRILQMILCNCRF